MWMLLVLVGMMVYLSFFWSPDEAKATTSGSLPATGGQTSVTFHPPSQPLRFDSQKVWYGISFHGYQDEYSFSTTRAPGEARELARTFFINANTKVVLEDASRLTF